MNRRNFLLSVLFSLRLTAWGSQPKASGKTPEEKRKQMVETQIKARGIKDPELLKAMQGVERHLLVPKRLQRYAYQARALPIGHGQTISKPYIVAFMTDSLKLQPSYRVLEIGTGSGYQAAVLAKLSKEVYTIEIVKALGESAKKRLEELGYKNIETRVGDGYNGWPEKAPFDAILVTAAPDHIPQPLIDQLKPGGQLVMPIGRGHQKLIRLTKTTEGLKRETLLSVRFVPMTGQAQKKKPKR